jgi:Ca2+-transporting ATPase
MPSADVASRLGSDVACGLDPATAAARLEADGPNQLAAPRPVPAWRRFARQLAAPVIWILLVATALAAALGEWAEAAAILAIVVANAVIGFLQEERAQQALASLERLTVPQARVRRGGLVSVVPAAAVVAGDRLELEAGDAVAADGRLVEAHGLETQEAALTGESQPVAKDPRSSVAAGAAVADRATMVHAGTVITAGRGAALVTATGMQSQLGRIARLLDQGPTEPTPLERRMAALGRALVVTCLGIVGAIAAVEIARGGGWWDVLLRGVSLAVAAVPEGLPAVVTLVLALGVQRMVRHNALVRRLPSVETLGTVTVVCSDKTGTLTRNAMTLRAAVTAATAWHATDTDDGQPLGTAGALGEPAVAALPDARDRADLDRLLLVGGRCTNAAVRARPTGGWEVTGDPTEGALVVAAVRAGILVPDPAERVVAELPFDATRRMMTVRVAPTAAPTWLATKGAPEAVLAACTREQCRGAIVPLGAARREAILASAAGLAAGALRVLALAWRPDDDPGAAPVEGELVFTGLVGLIDPPRPEARAAVARCRTAGIRPVMITGDHPLTALAIARELGIATAGGAVVEGAELERLPDAALVDRVGRIDVYARVSPEHKLRVVRAWQATGAIVAMTGDGVNDAPAVEAADVGIAMGVSGTDVTRAAADMVLTDDNFASIVAAIEEGRGIDANIRRVVHYLLACNAGEVLMMFAAAVAGWPAPLAAIQILWLNLVTDGFPALALGLEPPEPDAMRRPPRPPRAALVTLPHGLVLLAHGGLMAAVTLVGFGLVWQGDAGRLREARTVAFSVAAASQLGFALACRSDRFTALERGVFRNPALLVALLLAALLQTTLVMLPVTAPLVAAEPPATHHWLLVVGLSLLPVTVAEVAKIVRRLLPQRTAWSGAR